ncbi:MAG: energy transducer TonB [Spirochaetaceae bacterium]|jgi:protein TonB|nr:energy transducer TonB [Spirochaetaceae bacterium]
MAKSGLLRLGLFLFAALLHGIALFCFVVYVEPSRTAAAASPPVIRLVNIQEEPPPPLPAPPPPPPQRAPEPPAAPSAAPPLPGGQNAAESPAAEAEIAASAIAEHMIVVDEVPEGQPPVGSDLPASPGRFPFSSSGEPETYVPQEVVTKRPEFSERDIRRNLIYPPLAKRAKIEGRVVLEFLIDRKGEIQRITVLEETPPGRGFGEAAVRAFRDQRCVPAEVNNVPVAVRYRYPVEFRMQ